MKPFRELPLELKLFCVECKNVQIFALSGFARNGFFYRCTKCGKMKILIEEEIDYYMSIT